MKIQVKLLEEDSKVPVYATIGSAGCDFYASTDFVLPPTLVKPTFSSDLEKDVLEQAGILFASNSNYSEEAKAKVFLEFLTRAVTEAHYDFEIGRHVIPTGLAFGIPEGSNVELELRGRSGLAFKNNVIPVQGTVDEDFNLEVSILLYNYSSTPMVFKKGDRICQGVFKQIIQADFEIVEEIKPVVVEDGTRTKNNNIKAVKREGGYGSTGL